MAQKISAYANKVFWGWQNLAASIIRYVIAEAVPLYLRRRFAFRKLSPNFLKAPAVAAEWLLFPAPVILSGLRFTGVRGLLRIFENGRF